MTVALAIIAGLFIGLSLGALGGGGSILAVPVLVYLLGQSAPQATTGSLVVVAVTSLISAVAARRNGQVMLARGAAFGAVAIGGAVLGARAATQVADSVLLALFAILMLFVAGLMAIRQLRRFRRAAPERAPTRPAIDDPIVRLREGFACDCPRAAKVLIAATAAGLLTGFLGVGGGFLVVPALSAALALPVRDAAGTSLVVITIVSAAALAVRADAGAAPAWGLLAALAVAPAIGGLLGTAVLKRADPDRIAFAFTFLVLAVAIYTGARALPTLA